MMINNHCYLDKNQICEITGLGSSKAYEIIRRLNDELAREGFIVIRGKVPRKYFIKRSGLTEEEVNSALGIGEVQC